MAGAKRLVIGASGFLGSHVTRQLVDRGDDVRVLIRRTSSTKAIEDLDVEYHYGDIFDDAAVQTAMAGCDDVFYCAPARHCAVESHRAIDAHLPDAGPRKGRTLAGLAA
jgi:nucleoside-diphosphate-sugar epimerase